MNFKELERQLQNKISEAVFATVKTLLAQATVANSSHGVVSTYRRGCRCDLCREANNKYTGDRAKRDRALAREARESAKKPTRKRAPAREKKRVMGYADLTIDAPEALLASAATEQRDEP